MIIKGAEETAKRSNLAPQPILVAGRWQPSPTSAAFPAFDPASGRKLPLRFPISRWEDCETALKAAASAAVEMAALAPEVIADFLEDYALRLAQNSTEICEQAHHETALPIHPRLADVEMPRTVNQLKMAAAAARDGSWRLATIDLTGEIRSCYGPVGPIAVFGPNNFPFAFNGISGGDFAAAIAAGNPVIAKAHPSHPRTTQLMAELAHEAASVTRLPSGAVQLIYKIPREVGLHMIADSRLAAVAFTGSRPAGMALKAAADAAGKPIYLEMSSVNPVVFLSGAVRERPAELVDELAGSCLLGAGQFCTCPNLFVLFSGDEADQFLTALAAELQSRPAGTLLSEGVLEALCESIQSLTRAGAELVAGGAATPGPGFHHQNTLLKVSGGQFVKNASRLQTEAFGNATMAVVADGLEQACEVVRRMEGSLTGSIYSATDGSDDAAYEAVAAILRRRVGRLLNDKMPTGVAVSPAMNHGGPFPATGHPGFTAVGIPASMRRFAMLECYDNVRPDRLPPWLRNESPNGKIWREIDGRWTQDSIAER